MGHIQDRKETLGSLFFRCSLLPFVWSDLGLGVPSGLGGLFGSEERRGARVRPREREPETA